jgi:hypothetical protein
MAPPNPYYPERPGVSGDLVRESRTSEKLRLRMVRFAKKEGVKPAARAFDPTLGVGPKSGANAPGTTPKTVRKWLGRFDGTLSSQMTRSATTTGMKHFHGGRTEDLSGSLFRRSMDMLGPRRS